MAYLASSISLSDHQIKSKAIFHFKRFNQFGKKEQQKQQMMVKFSSRRWLVEGKCWRLFWFDTMARSYQAKTLRSVGWLVGWLVRSILERKQTNYIYQIISAASPFYGWRNRRDSFLMSYFVPLFLLFSSFQHRLGE